MYVKTIGYIVLIMYSNVKSTRAPPSVVEPGRAPPAVMGEQAPLQMGSGRRQPAHPECGGAGEGALADTALPLGLF